MLSLAFEQAKNELAQGVNRRNCRPAGIGGTMTYSLPRQPSQNFFPAAITQKRPTTDNLY